MAVQVAASIVDIRQMRHLATAEKEAAEAIKQSIDNGVVDEIHNEIRSAINSIPDRNDSFRKYMERFLFKLKIGNTAFVRGTAEEVAEAAEKIQMHRKEVKAGKQGSYAYGEGIIYWTKDKFIGSQEGFLRLYGKIVRSGDDINKLPNIFTPIPVEKNQMIGGTWLRESDAEYKVLNQLAHSLGAVKGQIYRNISGELKIVSERTYCPSCAGVIAQFHEMFPNIKLTLIDGIIN